MPRTLKPILTPQTQPSTQSCIINPNLKPYTQPPTTGPLWIMSEFMDGGSLEDFYKVATPICLGVFFKLVRVYDTSMNIGLAGLI